MPARRRVKSFSLTSSAVVPPTMAAWMRLGESRSIARRTGMRPRTLTRNGNTLPALVSVPSKSKAATVGRSAEGGPPSGRSVDRSATPSLSSRKPGRPGQRLPATDDLAAAAGLVDRRLLLGHAPLLERAHAIRAQAELGERRQLVGEGDSGGTGLAGRYDPVDEAQGERLGGHDSAARQDHVHGAAVADEAGQAHGAEVEQRDPEAPAEHAEDRVLGSDAEVAPEGELDAACHRIALDRRDHGLGERQPG